MLTSLKNMNIIETFWIWFINHFRWEKLWLCPTLIWETIVCLIFIWFDFLTSHLADSSKNTSQAYGSPDKYCSKIEFKGVNDGGCISRSIHGRNLIYIAFKILSSVYLRIDQKFLDLTSICFSIYAICLLNAMNHSLWSITLI